MILFGDEVNVTVCGPVRSDRLHLVLLQWQLGVELRFKSKGNQKWSQTCENELVRRLHLKQAFQFVRHGCRDDQWLTQELVPQQFQVTLQGNKGLNILKENTLKRSEMWAKIFKSIWHDSNKELNVTKLIIGAYLPVKLLRIFELLHSQRKSTSESHPRHYNCSKRNHSIWRPFSRRRRVFLRVEIINPFPKWKTTVFFDFIEDLQNMTFSAY